jgi:tetrapyrrole methylase family protein/MazG family protein
VTFDDLVGMMAHLRSPQGCPWDREQDHHSLRPYLLEEAYETIEAIELGDPRKLRDELGDVLLQVLFHAQLGAEAGEFAIDDVLAALARKLRTRHEHVWGDVDLPDPESVLANWERIKRSERGHQHAASVLAEVPQVLPALMRAQTVSRKAARTGFDWSQIEGPLAKLEEEIAELREALANPAKEMAGKPGSSPEAVAREIGDLGIALVNVARWAGVDAETAVREAIERFIRRFRHLEEYAHAHGRRLEEMSVEEMDKLWEEAKELGGND